MVTGTEGIDMGGFDPNNHLPSDTAKLGQKAHDDHHEHTQKKKKKHYDDPEEELEERAFEKGKLVPVWPYVRRKAWEGAKQGSITMVIFGSLLTACLLATTSIVEAIAPGILDSPQLAQLIGTHGGETLLVSALKKVGMLAGIVTTGAIWYGGSAGKKAYEEANEHNVQVLENVKERFGKGHAKEKTQDGGIAPTIPEQGAIIAADTILPGFNTTGQTTGKRPEYLDRILQRGPRSLSPRELAERIEAEQAAAKESSL